MCTDGFDVIPEFDPAKLVIAGSNIRRKDKVSIWETPEEYLDMGNSGLYKGHYEIMRFIGYEFKADSEDQLQQLKLFCFNNYSY